MVHKLSDPAAGPRRLTQSVLQIAQMLDLYDAELARVLGLKCHDIGQLTSGTADLQPDSDPWRQAMLLVRCYQALFDCKAGDGVAMRNWLRIDNPALKGVPLLLMVDEGRLGEVVAWLEQRADGGGV
jgi:hypothetical protein